MLFSSIVFMFYFLPIVIGIYYVIPKRYRNISLFIFNLIFYGWKEPIFIVLMLFSTVNDYFLGNKVYQHRDNKIKAKRFLYASIIINLSMLGFFKYTDFFIQNINTLFNLHIPLLYLTLPIGISFYTFQTMSYTIDIYRGQATPSKNIIDFGTYITLFPQLIAGPIVRYKDIATQLHHRTESIERFYQGVTRFLVGLTKKVFLANNIGLVWDAIQKQNPNDYSMLLGWVGIIAFAFQIYFDFSGYSDMAIGLAKMFGFELLENFNYPYISESLTDFWRRWHMSLGIWFREYVYIPLGGNRKGLKRTYINLSIVWFLTGFWHGASWNFILWGMLYGVMLMIEKAFLLDLLKKIPRTLRHVYALFFVLIGWALFHFIDLSKAIAFIKNLFNFNHFIDQQALFTLNNQAIMLIICVIACLPIGKKYSSILINKHPWISPILVLSSLILCTMYLVDSSFNPFLYFRF